MAYNQPKGLTYTNGNISLLIIPKNASTTLRNSLKLNKSYNRLTEPNDTKLFCVIREPISRLISGYLEILNRAKIDSPLTLDKKFFNMVDGKDKFDEFIRELGDGFFDAHVEPQTYYLTDENGDDIPMDYVLNFEHLGSDIKKINDINLSHLNRKPNNEKKTILDYIENDKSLMLRIRELYKEDFILYEKFRS